MIKFKKIICIVTCISLLSCNMVYASSLEDNLKNQQQQLKQSKNTYADVINDIEATEAQILNLDRSMDKLDNDISLINEKISVNKQNISKTLQLIKKQTQKVNYQNALLHDRVKSAYINNTGSMQQYISVLLDSTSISDFAERLQTIKHIILKDKEILEKYNKLKKDLEDSKIKLDKEKADLNKSKTELQVKMNSLQATKTKQNTLLAELKQKKAQNEKQIQQYQANVNKIVKAIKEEAERLAEERRKHQNGGSSQGPSGEIIQNGNFSNIDIVNYALSFQGCPYLWGGIGYPLTMSDINRYRGTGHDISDMTSYIGKQAFDCSGLMQYVYKHFGINITRTTYTQIKCGKAVSSNNLAPADLVFFGDSPGDPYHVGMYIGNGYFVQAPYSGDVVKVSLLSSRHDFIGARRYLN